MRKLLIFIGMFFILFILSFIGLSLEKNSKIQEHLDSKTKQYLQNYKVLYEEHKTLSEMIFKTRINTSHVVKIFKDATLSNDEKKDEARVKLYEHLENTYKLLKHFNIKQLHFHLPNNNSFLRFHRPKQFGDNLAEVRSTVRYVNKYKEPVDGFEEGKIYNGYRFVYPMFYNKHYIGSVEVSFSTLAMNLEYMHDYDVTSNFLILKKVVKQKVFEGEQKNYTPSMLKDFYLEKAMLKHIINARGIKVKQPLSQTTKDIIDKKALTINSFSLYDNIRKDIMTFIKVKNPISNKVVGLFVVRSDAEYIFNKTKNFYMMLGLITFIIVIKLFLIYKEMLYRKKIELSNKQLYNSRLETMKLNETLESRVQDEVQKNRKKDQQMIQQSRLAQMGEMISMIAHQWRQPLGAISATAIDMKMKIELETFDLSDAKDRELCLDYFIQNLNSIDNFVHNLTTTIDDFRNFYKPNKDISNSLIALPIYTALKIVNPTFLIDSISIVEESKATNEVGIYTNEIVQVFLNILKNAQDNFKEKSTKDAGIFIKSKNIDSGVLIEICDNGGGISEDVIDKIFDPYFSTKNEKNGSGLGLYMSKMIIEEHHKGKLSVSNIRDGVCFKIEINNEVI